LLLGREHGRTIPLADTYRRPREKRSPALQSPRLFK
jgi:hypothetical protein